MKLTVADCAMEMLMDIIAIATTNTWDGERVDFNSHKMTECYSNVVLIAIL